MHARLDGVGLFGICEGGHGLDSCVKRVFTGVHGIVLSLWMGRPRTNTWEGHTESEYTDRRVTVYGSLLKAQAKGS